VEIIRLLIPRILNLGSRIDRQGPVFQNSKSLLLITIALAMLSASCSKKPVELYREGMSSFTAGKYADAQESFARGIKKNVQSDIFGKGDSLYAGFIAANLVTGKYSAVNSAYNDFTDSIHASLVRMYGEKTMMLIGATTKIIPYKAEGGNKLPSDFPETVAVQGIADHKDFAAIKQQIDDIIRK